MKIKIGIIGAGLAFERLHYPAYQRATEQFEIVGVCDTNLEKAKNAATMLGLPESAACTDYETLLQNPEVEAVDIMVPIAENYNVAKAAILNGKSIIAEKPFASTIKGAKELIKLGKAHGSKILVAENFRYDEENTIIKKLIDEKTIGNVAYFIDNNVIEFQKEMLGDTFAAKEWRQHPDYYGGVFLDYAVHHIARLRFLFGDVMKLYAEGRPGGSDFSPYSCITALLTFKDHIAGQYAFFNIAKETQAPLVGLRIFGTHGEIFLEGKDCGFVNLSLKDGTHQAIPYRPEEGYYNELMNFYNALRNGEPIVSTPEKELGDMEIIFGILKFIEREQKSEI